MSCRKFSARSDVQSYRQFFARRWQAFVNENFESPAHVALAFRVDSSTAENWWAGHNAPQGWVVGRAMSDPKLRDAAISHLSGDA